MVKWRDMQDLLKGKISADMEVPQVAEGSQDEGDLDNLFDTESSDEDFNNEPADRELMLDKDIDLSAPLLRDS